MSRISLRKTESKENLRAQEKSMKIDIKSLRASKRLSNSNHLSNVDVSPPKNRTIESKREPSLSPEITKCLSEKLKLSGSPKPKTKYQNARQALSNNINDSLPGREHEYEELTTFLNNIIDTDGSGSLYISGPPGTGKTATLSKIINTDEFSSKIKMVYVNCTSISSIGSIYKKICNELKLKVSRHTEKDHLNAIEEYLEKKHKLTMLVLDEIDQLAGNKQTILYNIFEWPSWQDSRLILIGIANALDLTDRLLVRLQTKCELKPKLMNFPPYTKEQIVDIFKNRLAENGVMELFPQTTLQLLAAKVSSVSGDIRRALDFGRRVVEIVEKEKRKNRKIDLKKIEAELGCKSIEEEESCGPVQIKEVMTVFNQVYGASQNLDLDMDEDAFPLQQKILICSLLLIIKNDKNKDVTIGRLHEVYKKVCSKRNLLAVDQAEFVGLCSLVETRGILRIQKKKETRLHRVCLQWDESEVTLALKDKQLITSILNDLSSLSK